MLVESAFGRIGGVGARPVHHVGGTDVPWRDLFHRPSWGGWRGRDASAGRRGNVLLGRQAECDALDRLLSAVRVGESRSLLVHGEAGMGKSALLEYVRDSVSGVRIAAAAGTVTERELAFGGLHQLCAPFLDHLPRLPEPQRDALGTAFGLSAGAAPDRFLVGLAVLGLFADVAEKEPLVCLVDDAQWLDQVSLQTLAFVARRLPAEPVGLILAMREPCLPSDVVGLPQLEVGGLSDSDARALLDSVTPGRLDEQVRDRIIAETRGNPLALLDPFPGSTPAEQAGGFGWPDARPLANQVELDFLQCVEALPEETRHLLVIAAAEPTGDVALLTRAAELMGIKADAGTPAEVAGLITIGTLVRFRHPLVRSAVYRMAAPDNRRNVHRALADATGLHGDRVRRAWHLANATAGLDEIVAAELEHSADRAQTRGGVAAAAAFLERAAQLTPDPARRGTRALTAARAKYRAGGYDAALDLLDAAELGPLDERGRARSKLLRAQIVFASTGGGAALPLLYQAGKDLEPLDPGLARATYRDALSAATMAGRPASGAQLADVALAALAAPPGPPPERHESLLSGVAMVATKGYSAGVPVVRQTLDAFRVEGISGEEGLGWLSFACHMAPLVWDFDNWSALSAKLVELARESGALSVLPSALHMLVSNRAAAGEFAAAETLLAEAVMIGEATGSRLLARYTALVLEPWKGRETATRHVIEAVMREVAPQEEGEVDVTAQWASAVLYNGLGRYEEAYGAAARGSGHAQELASPAVGSLIELVEAAARSRRPARAADAAQRIDEMAQASGTGWALGTSASMRAQVSDGPAAETLYREAIERLERTGARMMLARSRLLYGEWLRRENRRMDAREHLGVAYEMLSQMGAEAFKERARRELQATGEKVGKRTAEVRVTLTTQEVQIARLAGEGLTNLQIGSQLFISPRTVEWHLRKVFGKLGIVSRKQLRATLLDGAGSMS
ncbi:AAA family ATPase [Nonomuraea sp. FMUSA5-5]|uniref:AAA family ATPase n=1 Tax=Nonomuraea composti TaxID=2720023 RepID=A0ABX1BJ11_9ACTN|nr:LuxR family transcriptional regulator [Nonomuraea sp. FMUSA5-5]NJP95088.1 AAA family ATPase [Nonomuraea sp. FMUSA5-5]